MPICRCACSVPSRVSGPSFPSGTAFDGCVERNMHAFLYFLPRRPLICRINKPDGYDAWAAACTAAGGGLGAAQPAGEAGQGADGGGAPSSGLPLPESQVYLVLGEPFATSGARLRQLPDHAQHDPDMPAARGTRGRPLKAKPKAQLSEVAS